MLLSHRRGQTSRMVTPDQKREEHTDETSSGAPHADLTEAQKKALADAISAARTAQATVDELSSLRSLLRRASSKRRRRTGGTEKPADAAVHVPEEMQEPKTLPDDVWPATRRRVRNSRPEQRELPDPEKIREIYFSTRSLVRFGNTLGLCRRTAIKALATAGIDIYEDIASEWENRCSMRVLSNRHAVTRATISRWIKKAGREVKPRNGNRTYNEDLIERVYLERRSANQPALAGKVHWSTARRILKERGLWERRE